MVDVTSKYEVELSAKEQETLDNGGSVPIELPDVTVDLTTASGGSLAASVPERDDDVQVDEEVGLEDLEDEVREAQQQDTNVELEGGSGGAPNTGMIEKNPDQGGN